MKGKESGLFHAMYTGKDNEEDVLELFENFIVSY